MQWPVQIGMAQTSRLVTAATALSVLSLLAGLVYVTLIPLRPLVAQGVYIDEHAFLPHQAAPAPVDLADVKAIDAVLFDWSVSTLPNSCFLSLAVSSNRAFLLASSRLPMQHIVFLR